MRAALILALLCALVAPAPAAPGDWTVSAGGSIQAALDQASPGDRILVGPGTYPETLNYGGKDLEVIAIEGPDVTILGDPGLARCVDHYLITTTAARLEGFTLVPGNAGADTGCCVRIQAQSALTVSGCRVSGAATVPFLVNASTLVLEGGSVSDCSWRAILAYSSLVDIDAVEFDTCWVSDSEGGAIYFQGGELTVRGALFSNCSTTNGGACWLDACTVTIEQTTFQDNSATGWGSGGALFVRNSQALVQECLFASNISHGPGGVLEFGGGAIWSADSGTTLESCIFDQNRSNRRGGAIYAYGTGTLDLLDCRLTRNSCAQDGEALACRDSVDSSAQNCVFFENGDGDSGDVHIVWHGSGGLLDLSTSTFAYNSGPIGYRAAFTDCIFWGHGGFAALCSFTHCDVQGGAAGTGNFDLDPLFVSYAGEDFNVLPGSPCLGAGVSGGDVGASLSLGLADCNGNGVSDALDALGNDCDGNGVPDECDPDCNGNGQPDACDIAGGASLDLDGDGVPDECSPDCDQDGTPDFVEILYGAPDCNGDGVPDECETDCDANGVPDECDITLGGAADCNGNLVPDDCESDCDGNGVPDDCDLAAGAGDCDQNGIPDVCDLVTMDCNSNGVVDSCDIASGTSLDLDGNGFPDECKPDCNQNGIPDPLDIAFGSSLDCDGNGVPDECEDCDGNGVGDACDIQAGAPDCNANGLPDACDLASGFSEDCDGDTVPDACQIAQNPGLDADQNGVLDSCECGWTSYCVTSPNSVGTGALISASGSSGVSQADLTLEASLAPPTQFGIFFYAAGSGQTPLLDGVLCVSGQIYRLPAVQIDGLGNAVHLLDYSAPPGAGSEITGGSSWHFQFWYRDPTGGPNGSNLSDGLEVSFCP